MNHFHILANNFFTAFYLINISPSRKLLQSVYQNTLRITSDFMPKVTPTSQKNPFGILFLILFWTHSLFHSTEYNTKYKYNVTFVSTQLTCRTYTCTYIVMFERCKHLEFPVHPLARDKILEDVWHFLKGHSLSIPRICN